jgi:hypothetical protein
VPLSPPRDAGRVLGYEEGVGRVGLMMDFDKSWQEAVERAAALAAQVRQLEDEATNLDVKRDLARWLSRYEALAAELRALQEEANRAGG